MLFDQRLSFHCAHPSADPELAFQSSFIELDRSLLAERWSIEDWYQPGRYKSLRALITRLRRSAVVVG